MKTNHRRGQSILEYTLILGAVIGVVVVVLLSPNGIKDKVSGAYNRTGEALANTTADLTGGIFQ